MSTWADQNQWLSTLERTLNQWFEQATDRCHQSSINLTRLTQLGLVLVTVLSLGGLAWTAWNHAQPPADMQAASTATLNIVPEGDDSTALFGAAVELNLTDHVAAAPSSWHLQGAFTGSDATSGSAILSDGKAAGRLVKTTQALPDGSTLAEVHADHVVLLHQGQRQMVYFPRPQSGDSSRQWASNAAATPSSGQQQPAAGSDNPAEQRRTIVRRRLETLRQRALQRG